MTLVRLRVHGGASNEWSECFHEDLSQKDFGSGTEEKTRWKSLVTLEVHSGSGSGLNACEDWMLSCLVSTDT
jgi:hypothetical protein